MSEQLQQRAAEQLFRVLGELKGGAMKFGQALSLFESVLPEDVAAPIGPIWPGCKTQHRRCRHLECTPSWREFGSRWRQSFTDFDPLPAAAASIGQVHQATWADGRTVAVKVQYPGADEALRSDLRQIGRLSKVFAPLAGGMDECAGGGAHRPGQRRTRLHPRSSLPAAGSNRLRRCSKEFCVPPVLASTPKVMVSEWVEGAPLSSAADLSDKKRNAAALQYEIPLRRAKHGWSFAC